MTRNYINCKQYIVYNIYAMRYVDGVKLESREESLKVINDPKRICLKCGETNNGRPFGVTITCKVLKVRKTKVGDRGMHEKCAQEWIDRIRLTSGNIGEVPEVAEAHREYEAAVESGVNSLARIRSDISGKDDLLTSVTRHHYRQQYDALKAGVASLPLDQRLIAHWKAGRTRSWCLPAPAHVEGPRASTSQGSKSADPKNRMIAGNALERLIADLGTKISSEHGLTCTNRRRAVLEALWLEIIDKVVGRERTESVDCRCGKILRLVPRAQSQ